MGEGIVTAREIYYFSTGCSLKWLQMSSYRAFMTKKKKEDCIAEEHTH